MTPTYTVYTLSSASRQPDAIISQPNPTYLSAREPGAELPDGLEEVYVVGADVVLGEANDGALKLNRFWREVQIRATCTGWSIRPDSGVELTMTLIVPSPARFHLGCCGVGRNG